MSRVGPSARVVVNVLRNTQPPRFIGEPYVKNITEAQETGSTIFTLRSEDRDQQVNVAHFYPNHTVFILLLFEIVHVNFFCHSYKNNKILTGSLQQNNL